MRKRTHKSTDVHSDWLAQVDVDGPFLAYPVLKDMWPSGVDRLGDTDDRLITFKQAYAQWQRAFDHFVEQPRTPESKAAYDAVRRAWIDVVLNDMAEWDHLSSVSDVTVFSPGEQITVSATCALNGRDGQTAALLLVCDPTSGLRDAGPDGWAANEIDRLAMLLRKAQVEVGIVTDGQWWALVWAKEGKPTGSGMVNALTWAEEPLLRDAFVTMINQRRFRAADAEQRLPRLFERSELEAEEITEALGTQVRRSVELLVKAFSEARLNAAKADDPDPLAEKPDDVYQAAVTVMMRIVFLLFAEEREMLPTEQLYWDSYAIKDLLEALRAQAADGEEQLDETFDAWYRLLAVSQALHGGVNYDEMRMPAYGGSLLDPDRFPWLHAINQGGRLRLEVSDRVMLHVLESVQTVVAKGERRRIFFREIDVEQIGYIYEGLLGYSCAEVADDIILGLVGKDGAEPEIPLASINDLYDEHGGDSKKFASALVAWTKEHQPAATGKTAAALAKMIDKELAGDDRAELMRLLTPIAAGDMELLATLVSWGNLIRRDLRNIPLVFPVGGLVVVETPSRKNAGAHYTPRSLAEDVVLNALQPLVYDPGPLQTNDGNEWHPKSAAAILDLRVVDIAAGSGAFLVAAAKYLSERLVEAWIAEGLLDEAAFAEAEDLRRRALREVIARCLYGADINPMAVEMCKVSLWLVSMDRTKPFSFVDDKIFCGNALLGLTSLDQLRYLHIDPKPTKMQQQLLVDIDDKIDTATQLRHELASPVEERDPMRSSRAKSRLLEQFHQATDDLRLIADGIIAAGLPIGGKPGRQLEDALKTLSWQIQEAFPLDGSPGDLAKLLERISSGLTPTVETDYERWEPLHWVLEVPDVMIEHGGFDAVIGNPPFLGGKKVSGATGSNVREWFVNVLASGVKGNADLIAYFFLRAAQLLRKNGLVGLIATNTVAQGDTREVGLDQMIDGGFTIFRSVRSRKWPASSANLEYAAVWGAYGDVGSGCGRVADGQRVASISTLLEPEGRARGRAFQLRENRGIGYVGSNVNCIEEFCLPPETAASWITEDSRLQEVLRPYVSGEDLYQRPAMDASRWIIDFTGVVDSAIEAYGRPYEWLNERARPARRLLTNKPRLQERWWAYEAPGIDLRSKVAGLAQVLVMTRVSRTIMPARVTANAVYSENTVVFATDSYADQAVLSASPHTLWAMKYSSAMRTDPRYGPSDVFDTFPRPSTDEDLDAIGRQLDDERTRIMLRRGLGMTSLYNLVHNPSVANSSDPDVALMRSLHSELDEIVLAAYGWDDIERAPGHYEYRQLLRWTVSPSAQVEILDRLLELNHARARNEGQNVPAHSSSDGQDTLFV